MSDAFDFEEGRRPAQGARRSDEAGTGCADRPDPGTVQLEDLHAALAPVIDLAATPDLVPKGAMILRIIPAATVRSDPMLTTPKPPWPRTDQAGTGHGRAPGGRVPVSTDGGLLARGHAGGPTGLAQIWETTLQLRGEAGRRQVKDARVGLCHMMGGGSVCIIHMLVRE